MDDPFPLVAAGVVGAIGFSIIIWAVSLQKKALTASVSKQTEAMKSVDEGMVLQKESVALQKEAMELERENNRLLKEILKALKDKDAAS